MTKRSSIPWFDVGLDAWNLSLDCAAVIGLRVAKISCGGAPAVREAQRMVTEKAESLVHLQTAMMTGSMGHTPDVFADNLVRYLGGRVGANKKRLSATTSR